MEVNTVPDTHNNLEENSHRDFLNGLPVPGLFAWNSTSLIHPALFMLPHVALNPTGKPGSEWCETAPGRGWFGNPSQDGLTHQTLGPGPPGIYSVAKGLEKSLMVLEGCP